MKKKSSRRWGRFGLFWILMIAIVALTASTSLRFWKQIPLGLDLKGGFDLLYEIKPTSNQQLNSEGIQAALQAVQVRVDSLGVSSPVIELENGHYIRVDLAGNFNQQQYEQIIGTTADLKMYGQATLDPKTGKYTPDPKTILATGADLKSNSQWAQDQNGQNVVTLDFKDAGKWQNITKTYLGKPIYVFLNGNLLTDPVIQSIMSDGKSEISGGSLNTPDACITLAKQLNAGALPYPLQLVSSTSVGPTLGLASLTATMWAGLAAICLIFLFMVFLYRLAGFIASVCIVAYLYLLLLTFSGLHVVLTLPGIAAVVLGVGMAVDANIITYERIKDEMRNGRSLQSSILAGNKRAVRTILDSNATTFIAGGVMYWFGQADIRGFAISLMLSIVISLLTAVLLSRILILLITKSNFIRRPWWFGVGKGVIPQ